MLFDFIVIFVLVGIVYGIWIEREEIKESFYGMGFWGKSFCFIVVLSTIGHLFG